jgi:CDP-glucose 4,6-dehydratase
VADERGSPSMSFWRERNVLVTGCTGFLGWHLTDELVRRGANVVGLVRDLIPQAPFFLFGLDRRIRTIHGRVEDYETLERALGEYEVDAVFHLAAQAIVGVANRNPMATFETNIRGTWTLLEAVRRSPQVSRIVVASSDKAYGCHEQLPYDEDFALQGTHPYDVSKSCADLLTRAYHRTYDTPASITRCGNLFGPGDLNWSRIVPGTIRSLHCGERPVLRSDGSPTRERMDDASIRGAAFNFSTGEPISVLDLTWKLIRMMGREDLEPDVRNETRAEIPHQYLSSERSRKLLGWKPGASLDQRLAETTAWYTDHLSRGGTASG